MLLPYLKLLLRARKYKVRNDVGEIAFLKEKILPGTTALDIGSHKGGYLFHIRKSVGKEGAVHAFEPQKYLYDQLGRLIRNLRWTNVFIRNIAFSDQVGTTTLNIPANKKSVSSPAASLLNHFEGKISFRTETIQTDTVDEYCHSQRLVPQFIKIDVEGHELNVLKGARNVLSEYRPLLLIEIEERHAGKEGVLDTFSFLRSIGYKAWFFNGRERLPLEVFSFEQHQQLNVSGNYCNNFCFE